MSQRRHRRRKSPASLPQKKTGRLRQSKARSLEGGQSPVLLDAGKPDRESAKKSPAVRLSGRRLWGFRAMVVLLGPILFLGVMELGLRLVGFGFCPKAVVSCQVNGETVYCNNARFGWLFFSPRISREFTPFTFATHKQENTCRVFILGASAAQGVPNPSFSFGRVLQVTLNEAYPEVNFEVIVVAMAAINSHVVLEVARDCAQYQPDLFVVYLGNNEVVGPYGAGTVFSSFSRKLWFIRGGIAFRRIKLGQLLTRVLGSVRLRRGKLDEWRGMAMFLDRQVAMEDRRLETVYAHFQKNLQDIVRLGHDAGAKTVLCTVGSNLRDSPPFASLHSADMSAARLDLWESAYQEGVSHEEAGDYDQAVTAYMRAVAIDDGYADLQYRLGKCRYALAEHEAARGHFVRARNLDTLRFRADDRINQIIRDLARQGHANGLYLADAARAFAQNSPHQIPGVGLFHEHVHLNFHGNYILAQTVFEQIAEVLSRDQRAAGPLLSEAECARRLVMTDWDRYQNMDQLVNRYLKKAPFTHQLYHERRIREMEQVLSDLKASLTPERLKEVATYYSRAVEQDRDDWMLRERCALLLLTDMDDPAAAVKHYRAVVELLPHSYLAHYNLGAALFEMGDLQGAIAGYRNAIQLKPSYGQGHYRLGAAYQKTNETDKAIRHYAKAVYWQPNLVPAYNNLAEIWMRRQEVDKAIAVCRRGLKSSPESAILYCNLGVLLDKQNQREEAIAALQKAIELDPNSASIRNIANRIMGRRR